MMDETIRRADEALTEMVEFACSGRASCAELRRGLQASKALRGKLDAYQANSASVLAKRESHGDGGAGVLAQSAGLSRRTAAGQVKTAERLQALPEVQRRVESGEVSFTNAKALADTAEKTSADAVAEDSELLAKASALGPEQFVKEVGRWAASRQHDGGEADYRRLRRRRRLSIWDGDDGMVHLRGELDPVAGTKLRNRLQREAERLRRCDLKLPEGERRSYLQRMADALEGPTADARPGSGPSADICIVQHLNADGTKAFSEIAGGATIPQSVLDEHMSNAEITGIVFSDKGMPLWQGHTKSVATKAQKRALTARYGGCGGCGERPVLCQAHHIKPVSQGGPTDITNMMLICWSCHQKVHRHGWRAVRDGRGLYTIEPPDRIHYGPAHAPDPPPFLSPLPRSAAEGDDTAQHVQPGPRAGPAGPAAARQALRQATTGRTDPIGSTGPAAARQALRQATTGRTDPIGSTGPAAARQALRQRSPSGPSPPQSQTPEPLFDFTCARIPPTGESARIAPGEGCS